MINLHLGPYNAIDKYCRKVNKNGMWMFVCVCALDKIKA